MKETDLSLFSNSYHRKKISELSWLDFVKETMKTCIYQSSWAGVGASADIVNGAVSPHSL